MGKKAKKRKNFVGVGNPRQKPDSKKNIIFLLVGLPIPNEEKPTFASVGTILEGRNALLRVWFLKHF